jgi:hypothetical protein
MRGCGPVETAVHLWNHVDTGIFLHVQYLNAYAWLHLGELNSSQGIKILEGENPPSAVPTAMLFHSLLLAAYEEFCWLNWSR